MLLVAVIEKGNLDADAPCRPPIELTELAVCVVERNLDFGEPVAENGLVELVKPSVHLRKCGFHISCLVGYTTYIANAVPKMKSFKKNIPGKRQPE